MTYDIRNNENESRFETTVDGHTAFVEYEMEEPGMIVYTHTLVPDELSGCVEKYVALLAGVERLFEAGAAYSYCNSGFVVLDHARAQNLKVVPQCAYIAAWIQRHPDYADLIAAR